ncbi:MAG: molybdate ABC transporter substrate-binding protein [Spongiibacteraceae bacterium]
MGTKKFGARYVLALALLSNIGTICAEEIRAAVAANFTAAIKKLTPLYEQKSGNKLLASFGATGQLYAQISNGAPFDMLLSADDSTPKKLIGEGKAVDGSYFVYARGRLALWSGTPGYVDDQGAILKSDNFSKIAIANPKTAPYGQAAIEALSALKLLDQVQSKFVTGENIAQTQQFVSSGNVPLGFIALAQVKALPANERGSWWVVPAQLHQPIDQGAVLLKTPPLKSEHAVAAQTFLDFLKSPEAIAIIRDLGYEVP